MTHPFTGVRRIALFASCVAAAIIGAGLAFRLVTPESVQKLGTQELIALLGVLVLPLATLWAVQVESRRTTHADQPGATHPVAAAPIPVDLADPIVHSIPGRRDALRHRRIVQIQGADAA